MEILIYGAGGIGGYFGGKLAKAGNSVSMIARGAHLKAIKEKGLIVKSINGDFTVRPKLVTDNLLEVPAPDLVILGVKSWQISSAAKDLKRIIGKNTIVLPLQNGVDITEKLLESLPKENVLSGLCFIVSFIEAPGIIKHASFEPRIIFGEPTNLKSERIEKLKTIFDIAEIQSLIPENIELEIWKKFLFITTISGLGALTRISIDKMRQSNYLFDLMEKTATEIKAVANAKSIPITNEHITKAFDIIKNQPRGGTSSTQRDIMQGKPSELENFNGYIVKEGERLKVKTPVNRFIYECLKPMEAEARKGF